MDTSNSGGLIGKFYKIYKDKIISVLYKVFHRIKTEWLYSHAFMRSA